MTIEIQGQSIFYTQAGEGEAVLLLHGWGTDQSLFAPLIQLLAKRCRVLALDFPGFGQSPEPSFAWSLEEYADCVLRFLQALGIERCSLLGHSFGGRVILKLAARRLPSPKLQKLILVGAAGIKPEQSKKASLRQKRYQMGKRLLTLPPVRALFPEALEALRRRHGSADYRAASPLMRQVLVKTVNEDLAPLLPLIQPPTLLIWGRNDTATPLADGRRMERDIPDAGLVILENAGHYAFLERQAQFLRVIASFMQID
ncbi:MAG: alpha/beta hydrolase [Oscillospiraceae bacterium]|nr:alpha/beta hydrolase [Oscillospiraceae bacterium]